MKPILVTGGAGFIGSAFVRRRVAARPDQQVIVLDALTYAGNPANLKQVDQAKNFRFVRGDITDRKLVDSLFAEGLAAVVNFAAESHVDRSIKGAEDFIKTNVGGTQILLEAARTHRTGLFLQVSTDEVYGSLGETGRFTEKTPLAPNSPYAASKAAADLFCRAAFQTFGQPVVVTRCSNNYGPHQFPEKLIPLFVINAINNKPLPLYGDGLNVRDWIHVDDHVRGLDLVLDRGRPGEVYNIGADSEQTNLAITKQILKCLGRPADLIHYIADRPGHDRRYAIDSAKIRRELGWSPEVKFEEGLADTIAWYRDNDAWWSEIISGEYRKYYNEMYKNRLAAAKK